MVNFQIVNLPKSQLAKNIDQITTSIEAFWSFRVWVDFIAS